MDMRKVWTGFFKALGLLEVVPPTVELVKWWFLV
jgi:hypothetical protein